MNEKYLKKKPRDGLYFFYTPRATLIFNPKE